MPLGVPDAPMKSPVWLVPNITATIPFVVTLTAEPELTKFESTVSLVELPVMGLEHPVGRSIVQVLL